MKKILLSVAFIAASFTSIAQVGVGTTNPDASAALDVESTTKGFLPPRMTQVQMNAIASPAEGLIVYCLDCTTKGLYVNNGNEFVNVASGASASAAAGPPSDTTTTVVEVAGQNGTIWMDRNLGATQQATSSTDAASYGDLYQWGRAADGHQIRTSSTVAAPSTVTSADPGHGDFILTDATTDNNWTNFAGEDGLWQSGLNDPCPTGYRIPTETELDNERSAFSSNNAAGAASSALALPAAGSRSRSNGALSVVGSYGYYWSSTVSGTNARSLHFLSSNAFVNTNNRARGSSVRCIKE
ncbi:fibrobacter succinogenes major paralogous domain-containing protein [Polaribacter sp. Z022]|uniref:fibrobacter succinogenes major paralogous domain-containing protein n=1 Tax=Polaribacter sp. Z022 TaxID=2927125 RepID=UPI0020204411|nr:fibrobacter succinogenes major paralogous domain-containing protein [Polaribacter sp. Z022]MCL7753303.1 fibrobacter succinogenes major paralogous domain-containing protein [Polaribacter sp. Z022]